MAKLTMSAGFESSKIQRPPAGLKLHLETSEASYGMSVPYI